MDVSALLTDAFSRVPGVLRAAVAGLSDEELVHRPDPQANTIAWLAWHTARMQDVQIAPLAGTEQTWTSGGWYERFGLPFGPDAMGYGQDPGEVAQVVAPPELLLGYLDAVAAETAAYLARLTAQDLDVVVDEAWDPPVTLGVRLVSVVGDALEHGGQAAYLRGLVERARG